MVQIFWLVCAIVFGYLGIVGHVYAIRKIVLAVMERRRAADFKWLLAVDQAYTDCVRGRTGDQRQCTDPHAVKIAKHIYDRCEADRTYVCAWPPQRPAGWKRPS
jgi:hypothetical protein